MSRLTKALLFGFAIGSLGLLVGVAPFGTSLEEALGLHLLFKLRGERPVPSDVIIITMDKASADHMGLPDSPRKWPRSLHAHLIEKLTQQNVAVIAFDIIFSEDRNAENDKRFADAIQSAGNVVLADWIKTDKVPVMIPPAPSAAIWKLSVFCRRSPHWHAPHWFLLRLHCPKCLSR